MSLVGCFGSQVWTADNRGELRRRRQGRRCGLLAASLLALLGSVTGVEYIDRECALDRQARFPTMNCDKVFDNVCPWRRHRTVGLPLSINISVDVTYYVSTKQRCHASLNVSWEMIFIRARPLDLDGSGDDENGDVDDTDEDEDDEADGRKDVKGIQVEVLDVSYEFGPKACCLINNRNLRKLLDANDKVTLYLTCIDLPEGEFAVYVSTFPNYAVNWHKVVVARQNCRSTAATTTSVEPSRTSVTRATETPEPDMTYLWVVKVGLLSVLLAATFAVALVATIRRRWTQLREGLLPQRVTYVSDMHTSPGVSEQDNVCPPLEDFSSNAASSKFSRSGLFICYPPSIASSSQLGYQSQRLTSND